LINRIFINNQIRAREVRLIDETGKQVGIVSLEEALRMARERNLDLIQVTEKVEPPVCKIGEYGKYLYSLQKKEKAVKTHTSEVKGVRIGIATSLHDIETKVNQAEKFLKKGDRVRIEMILRGRQKAFKDMAKEKINQFLEILNKKVPIKLESDIKKDFRGLTTIVSKK
jgi:translation initiation factor IF-3